LIISEIKLFAQALDSYLSVRGRKLLTIDLSSLKIIGVFKTYVMVGVFVLPGVRMKSTKFLNSIEKLVGKGVR
jgi:hypothetical protein